MSARVTDTIPPSPSLPDKIGLLSQTSDSVIPQSLPLTLPPTISQTPLQPNSQEDYKDQDSSHHSQSQSDEEHHLASAPSSSSPSPSSPHMNRRTRSQAHVNGHSSQHTEKHENGNSNGSSAEGMNEVEHRRKYPLGADDEDSATQATRLMNREEFSLDNDPLDSMHSKDEGAVGFLELPKKDQRAFVLLVMLYFLQGIPMGLATGSVPFLLKQHLSYGQIGVFSLASYPYSMKLLWSPIVDAVWSRRLGRRKSWILPVQLISGLGMIYLGSHAEGMMAAAGAVGGAGIWTFTYWWFFLVFTCATQDIAVDGWALTILSHKHIAYASTAQTVGLTGGHFLSYTVFLAFNSPDFANKWFRTVPSPEGVMTLGGYLTFWGWIYILVTLGLAIFKKEDKTKEREGIMDVYKVMWGILKLRNVQIIIIVHLIAKLGFQANDAATSLKLLDKGFSQEDMALTVLIDFPFELGLGYYVGKWSSEYPPLQLWCWAFIGRLVAAAFAQFVVMIFPTEGVTSWYLLTVILEHVFSTSMNTTMFVAVSAFHAKIADPVIGGTYMTLLATVSNLGGTFPRFFILKLVDFFTRATCLPPTNPSTISSLKSKGISPITTPFSCALEADKHRCLENGGTCNVEMDGYYIVNILCILVGVVTFFGWIRPKASYLQALPLSAWRLRG